MDQMDSIGALGNTPLIPLAVDKYCLHIQDLSSNLPHPHCQSFLYQHIVHFCYCTQDCMMQMCICVCSLLLGNPNLKDPHLAAQAVWALIK